MKRVFLAVFACLIALSATVTACQPPAAVTSAGENERLALVREIKTFEKTLGFTETENFAEYAEEKEAYDYYFYTLVTELAYSLDDPALKFGEGKRQDISLDTKKYDTYFYSIQALAGIKTPITKSLIESSLPRFIFVVFHEDWHEQIQSPLGIEESSGEVIPYIAAMLFAETKYGRDSEVYRTLNRELNNKLKESRVFQNSYDQLLALYADYHSGKISEAETLNRKKQIIQSLDDDIDDIWGKRRDQLNNAFISFQMTYFRYLNLMYDVYTNNSNLIHTIEVMRGIPEQGGSFDNDIERVKGIEGRVVEYLESKIQSK